MSTGRALSYVNGAWMDGNPSLLGPLSHAFWLASSVFDGARSVARLAPDLDRHCQRALRSAEAIGLKPMITALEMEELCWDGIRRFPATAELYIRPLFYAEDGFLIPDPDGTRFVLTLQDMPLPKAPGFSACLATRRRPAPGTAPTEAKASCLYPNTYLALTDAKARGFENAVMLDPLGHVAEFATANLFIVKDGVASTPAANGTFLLGITRARVIQLLREAGVEVRERSIAWEEVRAADEVFSTGNYAKVWPATRIEDRELQPGPVAKLAAEKYWAFARACA
jgi:branched-chain amino acid aminotransferase